MPNIEDTKFYYLNGIKTGIDYDRYEYSSIGNKVWIKYGTTGHNVRICEGEQRWINKEGQLHRLNGPAVIYLPGKGHEQYWINNYPLNRNLVHFWYKSQGLEPGTALSSDHALLFKLKFG